jgi:hypothetical protein
MKLPNTVTTVETLQSKINAESMLDKLLTDAQFYKDFHDAVQPVLYALSVKLYGANSDPISIAELIEDSVDWINKGEIQ